MCRLTLLLGNEVPDLVCRSLHVTISVQRDHETWVTTLRQPHDAEKIGAFHFFHEFHKSVSLFLIRQRSPSSSASLNAFKNSSLSEAGSPILAKISSKFASCHREMQLHCTVFGRRADTRCAIGVRWVTTNRFGDLRSFCVLHAGVLGDIVLVVPSGKFCEVSVVVAPHLAARHLGLSRVDGRNGVLVHEREDAFTDFKMYSLA